MLPQYNLYDDPVCNWGCDMNYVKNHQKQGNLSSKSTETLLAYENAGAASYLAYLFDNGKLVGIMALVSTNYTSRYASYLSERYIMVPYYEGENTYFIGADDIDIDNAKTLVRMEVYSVSLLRTVYMPANSNQTRSSKISIEERTKRIINQISQELF